MSYTKRTCHSCGYRDIQPNMVQVEIEYVSGTSNTGITKRTVFGSILGAKNSSRQLGKWLLSPTKRVYKRRKKVWSCTTCAKTRSDGGVLSKVYSFFVAMIALFFILWILSLSGYLMAEGLPMLQNFIENLR